jgi:hypothetical protein
MSGQDQGDGLPSVSPSLDQGRGPVPADLASVVQGLDTPGQQKAAAGIIGAMSSEAKQGLAASVVQGLDTPGQQKAAAGIIGAMSSEAKQGLAASVVQGLDTPEQQKAAAEGVMSAVPMKQRQQVAQSLLGSPDKKTRQVLWYMVVSTLVVAIFVFGTMAFVLIYQKKPAEAPLALATTALGGVVGLIATSPGSGGSSD